ncbi:glycosyltransferase family 4 protein [Mycobacterium sp. CVI_P3]|uniref:Glycosyltransferase family 4 protein n=1 Tax=Mycobacterium pinniadriaticum TaxID=2994102 RepID=A0ABT3SJ15_9MYCO|nr:glycosyltransferase family 4 protein [Mycobacterium pinniadriaticum]MCX2932690.1 glycosyltransferase family 4 protein [Mycobacterium pinniadriaticum]MCX2939114.1 glycosyltransferase family 4 protein [Mycobacterium pinniadriaticum]
MSVALISAVDPYPTDAGKKVVLAGFLDYFADRNGPSNVHYIKIGKPPPGEFPVTLHCVPGPSSAHILRNVVTKVITGRASMQEAFLGSRDTRAAVHRVLDDIKPRLQVYDTVRMAQYVPHGVARHQICYLDDLFSERYDRMLKAAALYPELEVSPLGNFAEHVPHWLHPLATHRKSQSALLRLERAAIARSENRVATTFGRCLLINDEEADKLSRRTGVPVGRVQSLPPLVNVPTSARRRYQGVPVFVFIGLLSLPHNDDGLKSFLRDVWPLVLDQLPDARLRVIGRDARQTLLAQAAELADSVTVEGYVPDLDGVLNEAVALVNPLRFGSGIKLKVFEALGRSVPVVSSRIGAEGIASGPGTGILVADDPAETADLLCSLTSPARNAEVSREAGDHFLRTYSRQAVFEAYDDAFAPPL